MFFAHIWLRSVLSWLFEHHKPHRIWYFSLLIRVAFICASYISCIQNTWPFHRSPECFATSLVAEMLTCVGKSDLSLHEILVSVKPFVSQWNRSSSSSTRSSIWEKLVSLSWLCLSSLIWISLQMKPWTLVLPVMLYYCVSSGMFLKTKERKSDQSSSVRVACTFILFVWVMSPSSHFVFELFFLALLKLICGSLCERWTDCGNLSRYRCF